jgi:hypothetical protein
VHHRRRDALDELQARIIDVNKRVSPAEVRRSR